MILFSTSCAHYGSFGTLSGTCSISSFSIERESKAQLQKASAKR
jgi:hypothetical protein